MTPTVTVLIPTHDHVRLVPYAIRSAQEQRVADIEIFVVGDGAPPATREAVESIARSDPRVRYFDLPKGERHGERNRHTALQEAQGRIVAYLGDDDLWLPDHLDNLIAGLADADFAHTIHTAIRPDGGIYLNVADLADRRDAKAVRNGERNFFGPTVAGHLMSAYRALPEGWRPAPRDIPTDLHMWRQFLAQPGIRLRSILVSDTVHLASSERRQATPEEREAEMARVARQLSAPDGADWHRRETTAALARSVLELQVSRTKRIAQVAELMEKLASAQASVAEASRPPPPPPTPPPPPVEAPLAVAPAKTPAAQPDDVSMRLAIWEVAQVLKTLRRELRAETGSPPEQKPRARRRKAKRKPR